jgi:tungstate transport system ATP-binding protein
VIAVHANPSPLPLVLRDVSFAAGGVAILDHISLTLEAGTRTVILGPNGAGKSVLLRLCHGLLRPTAGTIEWQGTRPRRRPDAMVFQRPVMLRRSVAENVRYALAVAGVSRTERNARAQQLLALVGLDTLAERPAPRLSGGERQRLALARALAREPAVLFLDEPTASLDPAATLAIEELIRAISARGVKVVMTTHDLGEAARLAGDVVLLHRGEIAESGPAEQVLRNPQTDIGRRFMAGQLLL